MNFYSLRFILAVIVIITVIIICRYSLKNYDKRTNIIVITIISVLIGITNIVPIEKVFLKFNTLEEAFNYSYPNYDIVKVKNGENYSFIIYRDKSNQNYVTYFTKDKNKWLLTNPYGFKSKIRTYLDSNTTIKYTIIPKINIAYIEVMYLGEELIYNISDQRNTSFEKVSEGILNEMAYYQFENIIENIDKDYYLVINDNRIYLD